MSGPEPTKRSQLEHPPPEERATPSNMAFSACVSEAGSLLPKVIQSRTFEVGRMTSSKT